MRSLATTFGTTVRALREKRGLSQEKLAADSGLSRTYMSEIERGVTTVSRVTIEKLAGGLGVTMSRLLQHVESAL